MHCGDKFTIILAKSLYNTNSTGERGRYASVPEVGSVEALGEALVTAVKEEGGEGEEGSNSGWMMRNYQTALQKALEKSKRERETESATETEGESKTDTEGVEERKDSNGESQIDSKIESIGDRDSNRDSDCNSRWTIIQTIRQLVREQEHSLFQLTHSNSSNRDRENDENSHNHHTLSISPAIEEILTILYSMTTAITTRLSLPITTPISSTTINRALSIPLTPTTSSSLSISLSLSLSLSLTNAVPPSSISSLSPPLSVPLTSDLEYAVECHEDVFYALSTLVTRLSALLSQDIQLALDSIHQCTIPPNTSQTANVLDESTDSMSVIPMTTPSFVHNNGDNTYNNVNGNSASLPISSVNRTRFHSTFRLLLHVLSLITANVHTLSAVLNSESLKSALDVDLAFAYRRDSRGQGIHGQQGVVNEQNVDRHGVEGESEEDDEGGSRVRRGYQHRGGSDDGDDEDLEYGEGEGEYEEEEMEISQDGSQDGMFPVTSLTQAKGQQDEEHEQSQQRGSGKHKKATTTDALMSVDDNSVVGFHLDASSTNGGEGGQQSGKVSPRDNGVGKMPAGSSSNGAVDSERARSRGLGEKADTNGGGEGMFGASSGDGEDGQEVIDSAGINSLMLQQALHGDILHSSAAGTSANPTPGKVSAVAAFDAMLMSQSLSPALSFDNLPSLAVDQDVNQSVALESSQLSMSAMIIAPGIGGGPIPALEPGQGSPGMAYAGDSDEYLEEEDEEEEEWEDGDGSMGQDDEYFLPLESESFEFQQALLMSSIVDPALNGGAGGASSAAAAMASLLSSSRELMAVLRDVKERRGFPVIPKIRDSLNALASLVIVLLQQCQHQLAFPLVHSTSVSPILATELLQELIVPSSALPSLSSVPMLDCLYLLWEEIQVATSAGFDVFYDETEQKAVLFQIIRSPSSFLYIVPGVMKGLLRLNRAVPSSSSSANRDKDDDVVEDGDDEHKSVDGVIVIPEIDLITDMFEENVFLQEPDDDDEDDEDGEFDEEEEEGDENSASPEDFNVLSAPPSQYLHPSYTQSPSSTPSHSVSGFSSPSRKTKKSKQSSKRSVGGGIGGSKAGGTRGSSASMPFITCDDLIRLAEYLLSLYQVKAQNRQFASSSSSSQSIKGVEDISQLVNEHVITSFSQLLTCLLPFPLRCFRLYDSDGLAGLTTSLLSPSDEALRPWGDKMSKLLDLLLACMKEDMNMLISNTQSATVSVTLTSVILTLLFRTPRQNDSSSSGGVSTATIASNVTQFTTYELSAFLPFALAVVETIAAASAQRGLSNILFAQYFAIVAPFLSFYVRRMANPPRTWMPLLPVPSPHVVVALLATKTNMSGCGDRLFSSLSSLSASLSSHVSSGTPAGLVPLCTPWWWQDQLLSLELVRDSDLFASLNDWEVKVWYRLQARTLQCLSEKVVANYMTSPSSNAVLQTGAPAGSEHDEFVAKVWIEIAGLSIFDVTSSSNSSSPSGYSSLFSFVAKMISTLSSASTTSSVSSPMEVDPTSSILGRGRERDREQREKDREREKEERLTKQAFFGIFAGIVKIYFSSCMLSNKSESELRDFVRSPIGLSLGLNAMFVSACIHRDLVTASSIDVDMDDIMKTVHFCSQFRVFQTAMMKSMRWFNREIELVLRLTQQHNSLENTPSSSVDTALAEAKVELCWALSRWSDALNQAVKTAVSVTRESTSVSDGLAPVKIQKDWLLPRPPAPVVATTPARASSYASIPLPIPAATASTGGTLSVSAMSAKATEKAIEAVEVVSNSVEIALATSLISLYHDSNRLVKQLCWREIRRRSGCLAVDLLHWLVMQLDLSSSNQESSTEVSVSNNQQPALSSKSESKVKALLSSQTRKFLNELLQETFNESESEGFELEDGFAHSGLGHERHSATTYSTVSSILATLVPSPSLTLPIEGFQSSQTFSMNRLLSSVRDRLQSLIALTTASSLPKRRPSGANLAVAAITAVTKAPTRSVGLKRWRLSIAKDLCLLDIAQMLLAHSSDCTAGNGESSIVVSTSGSGGSNAYQTEYWEQLFTLFASRLAPFFQNTSNSANNQQAGDGAVTTSGSYFTIDHTLSSQPLAVPLNLVADDLAKSLSSHVSALTTSSVKGLREYHEIMSLLERTLSMFLSTAYHQHASVGNNNVLSAGIDASASSKLLHSLINLLQPLVQMNKSLAEAVECHLWHGKEVALQYIHTKTFFLETSSPIVTAGLHCPRGHFTLGFWLFPNEEDVCWMDDTEKEKEDNVDSKKPATGKKSRMHLLSRFPETGDFHMVELLRSHPMDIDSYTVSLHLVREEVEREGTVGEKEIIMYVEVHVITFLIQITNLSITPNAPPNPALSRHKKVLKKHVMRSAPLRSKEWNHVMIEVFQGPEYAAIAANGAVVARRSALDEDESGSEGEEEAVEIATNGGGRPLSALNRATSFVGARPGSTTGSRPTGNGIPPTTVSADWTTVLLAINQTDFTSKKFEGGKWHLHQNVIVGKLPLCLGKEIDIDSFYYHDEHDQPDRSNTEGNKEEKKDDEAKEKSVNGASSERDWIKMSDITWIPSSLHLQSHSYTPPSASASVPPTAGGNGMKTRRSSVADLAAERERERRNLAMVTKYPPTALIEVLNGCQRVSTMIVKIIHAMFSYYRSLSSSLSPSSCASSTSSSSLSSIFPTLTNSWTLVQLLRCLQVLLITGNKSSQRTVMQILRELILCFPSELLASVFSTANGRSRVVSDDNDEIDGADDESKSESKGEGKESVVYDTPKKKKAVSESTSITMASPLNAAAGSARNAAMRQKASQLMLSTLRLLVELVGSLMDPLYNPMSSSVMPTSLSLSTPSPIPHSALMMRTLWDQRLVLSRVGLDSLMNVSTWMSSFALDEGGLFQDITAIFVDVLSALSCSPKDMVGVKNEEVVMIDALTQAKGTLYPWSAASPNTVTVDTGVPSTTDSLMISSARNKGLVRSVLHLLTLSMQGGWMPLVRHGVIVDMMPRRYSLTLSVTPSLANTLGSSNQSQSSSSGGKSGSSTSTNNTGSSTMMTAMDQIVFPSTAQVVTESVGNSNNNTVSVWLKNCAALSHCVRSLLATKDHFVAVPQSSCNLLLSSTEMASPQDYHRILRLTDSLAGISDGKDSAAVMEELTKLLSLPTYAKLETALKSALAIARKADSPLTQTSATGATVPPVPGLTAGAIAPTSTPAVIVAAMASLSMSDETKTVSESKEVREGENKGKCEEVEKEEDCSVQSPLIDLFQSMMSLRSLVVQLHTISQSVLNNDGESVKDRQVFDNPVVSSLLSTLLQPKILSEMLTFACKDPAETVASIFESTNFQGIQVDVLKNLLKEGDVHFLEKLTTRLWKQFRYRDFLWAPASGGNTSVPTNIPAGTTLGSVNSTTGVPVGICATGVTSKYVSEYDPYISLTALAGEVTITGNKVRASSHFPSIRLQDCGLERMTGRWFYECTLLSDGLMQIGWANALFRCDPICGQGVGDHLHSYAFDGLRMKKWNVSCDGYGKRWKVGDILGVLVDMDLLEMRFYLNGEDLGTAFEDFSVYQGPASSAASATASVYSLFPAFSLNVRQSLRVNFGQYHFLFPPDQVDGKAYRPIVQAIKSLQAITGFHVSPYAGSASAMSSPSNPMLVSSSGKQSTPAVGSTGAVGADGVAMRAVTIAGSAPNERGEVSLSSSLGGSNSVGLSGMTDEELIAQQVNAIQESVRRSAAEALELERQLFEEEEQRRIQEEEEDAAAKQQEDELRYMLVSLWLDRNHATMSNQSLFLLF